MHILGKYGANLQLFYHFQASKKQIPNIFLSSESLFFLKEQIEGMD